MESSDNMEELVEILQKLNIDGVNIYFHNCTFNLGRSKVAKLTNDDNQELLEKSEFSEELSEDEISDGGIIWKKPPKSGTIYLIREREFLRFDEDIYKIGRTSQKGLKRFNAYPKGSELYINFPSKNIIDDERQLIRIFDEKYEQMPKCGREYYLGDLNSMLVDIENYLNAKGIEPNMNLDSDNNCISTLEETIIDFVKHIKKDRPEWYVPGKFIAKKLLTKMYNDRYNDDKSTRAITTFIKKMGLDKKIIGEEKNVKMDLSSYGIIGKTFSSFKAL